MQHSDERPPASSRPSLLSSEQQEESDRNRILSGLDSKPASTTAGAHKARRGMLIWLVAGVAVLALGAGAALWLVSEGEKEIISAGAAPLPVTSGASAAPLASDPAHPSEDVSTAAILNETPASAMAGANSTTADLTEMLEQGSQESAGKQVALLPPVMASVPGVPSKGDSPATAPAQSVAPASVKAPVPAVVAKPAPVVVAKPVPTVAKPVPVAAKPAPAKVLAKQSVGKPVAGRDAAPAKRAAAPAKKAQTPIDNDVVLLAALVAHSKAKVPTAAAAPVSVAARLKQCKALSSRAKADQCRARVCTHGVKNETSCKAPRRTKATST